MWLPAVRPEMVWVPFAAALLRPVPLTVTEVALALDHVIVVEPGADVDVGFALMAAETVASAAIVTVWEMVLEVTPVESTALAVNVIVAGPLSDEVLPESLSVPFPPPAKAKGAPAFQMFTCERLPSASWPWAETV